MNIQTSMLAMDTENNYEIAENEWSVINETSMPLVLGKSFTAELYEFMPWDDYYDDYETYETVSSAKEHPAPIVPVLFDIAKTGESFTFKTLIANGEGNMAGSTVSVKLNERYAATVVIGADGIGSGTINAPGFTGNVANFSARVSGPGAAGVNVTKPMVVHSSGKVVPR